MNVPDLVADRTSDGQRPFSSPSHTGTCAQFGINGLRGRVFMSQTCVDVKAYQGKLLMIDAPLQLIGDGARAY
jgi:hypothetical protein